jgi:hypothetical protein
LSENCFKEFQFEGYTIRQLGIDDHVLLQGLCERCAGNNNIIVGSSREKNIGLGILKELPPGKTSQDKIVMGVFEDANLIGVLDMVKDFPVKGELILGLLMFDPAMTGRGLRGKTHNCVIKWAANLHFEKLRIDVAGDNLESYEFWKNIGYTETKRVNLKLGNKDKEIVIMNYEL